MRFQKKFCKKKVSIILLFFRRFRKKKRKKSSIKNEMQIRNRREELYEIRENWIESGETDTSPIDGGLAEFNWILNEEGKHQKDSKRELREARRQIKELKEKNRKMQIEINIMRGE